MGIEVREVLAAAAVSDAPVAGRIEQLLRDRAAGARCSRAPPSRLRCIEDAVQEALIAAADQWPRDGVPDNPRGWLLQVALRRMTDHIRSEIARRDREKVVADDTPLVVAPALYSEPQMDPHDTLVLLFMCCHPALSPASAIALTLRAVGGLTTGEIAAHLAAISKQERISADDDALLLVAKAGAGSMRDSLSLLDRVLSLVFNEGYTTSSGPSLHRTDLERSDSTDAQCISCCPTTPRWQTCSR